jgi:cyanophycinase
VERGTKFYAIGSSSVTVVDGSRVHFNNIADIREGMPISLAHLTVHIMTHSDVYNIQTREFSSHKFIPHEK